MKLTHASVFSGIGGPEIAATMLGWENVFHCEINPFGRAVLDYWYPKAKSYEDITKTDFSEWRGRVTVLTGGFPCQPFSYAGQRRGADDDRYLWPHMFRCIDQVQPDWVVAENVAGILTMVEQGEVSAMESQGTLFDEGDAVRRYRLRETFTLQRICDDLEGHGYEVQPVLVPACAVGAPHRRDRVFIIGHRVAADSDLGADGRAAREDAGKGGEERLQERHEVRKPYEPNQIRREGEGDAIADASFMHLNGGQFGDGCDGSRQPQPEFGSRYCTATSGRFHSDTSRKGLEGMHESRCGQGGQRLYIWRDAARCSGETIPDSDIHRGCEVDEHMEPQLADGYESFGNGWEWNATDTEKQRGERMRPQQPEAGGAQQEQPRGRGGEDGGVAGCGRWANFPSVSPVHRGNDGLPFDVDCLTIPFSKWRTESLKAYGNAIVPQVMYEIFRAIEIVEQEKL